ncbi:unnamed protein product [marine sediment metagenome]|uniref:Uncharacterized protein n=1 Tax=marine sediment metagenome TaxID=412755 RepID=X1L5P3_9ZZZZ
MTTFIEMMKAVLALEQKLQIELLEIISLNSSEKPANNDNKKQRA